MQGFRKRLNVCVGGKTCARAGVPRAGIAATLYCRASNFAYIRITKVRQTSTLTLKCF